MARGGGDQSPPCGALLGAAAHRRLAEVVDDQTQLWMTAGQFRYLDQGGGRLGDVFEGQTRFG